MYLAVLYIICISSLGIWSLVRFQHGGQLRNFNPFAGGK